MKKAISLVVALALCLSLCACGGGEVDNAKPDAVETTTPTNAPVQNVEIKTSPDKYTWYIKNYVGKNAASLGYTSMGGDRMEAYGNGYLRLVFQAPNGEYIDIHNEDALKEWRVIAQSLAPNTELKYTYEVDSDGNEYDNLIAHQNYEEIVLAVGPVGKDVAAPSLTAINPSDRYTTFVREYVGRNLSECGYTSMGGDRMDQYGHAYVRLALLSTNGDYVDIHDENDLKNWVVVAQNMQPNTDLTLSYELDSDGNEYDNLIAHQSIEEVLLAVAPVGESVEIPSLTAINPSDRYTAYIRDYVGRTLDQCGYISMGGNLMNQYGHAYIRLAVYSDDGSFIDLDDDSVLKNYVVTSQSVVPNTELTMTYTLDSEGNEYDNLVETQNIEEVELYVTRKNNYTNDEETTEPIVEDPEEAQSTETTDAEDQDSSEDVLVNGMRPEFKEAMDAYEAFYDEYCDFLEEYNENPSDTALIIKYGELLTKAAEMDEAFNKWTDEDLNSDELKYYLEVNNRVMQKLLEVTG